MFRVIIIYEFKYQFISFEWSHVINIKSKIDVFFKSNFELFKIFKQNLYNNRLSIITLVLFLY